MLLSADTTICNNQYITANKQCTIFQAFNSVLVTSSVTLDIQSCVPDGYLKASELGKKIKTNKLKKKRKTNPLKLLTYSEAEGEAFLTYIVAADET